MLPFDASGKRSTALRQSKTLAIDSDTECLHDTKPASSTQLQLKDWTARSVKVGVADNADGSNGMGARFIALDYHLSRTIDPQPLNLRQRRDVFSVSAKAANSNSR